MHGPRCHADSFLQVHSSKGPIGVKLRSFVAAIAFGAIAVAGCSSTSSPSATSETTAASAKQAVCTARTNLKASVTALASPALLTGGKAGIQAALDTVKTNLDAVASSAKSDYKPQVDAVQSAVNDLQTALGHLGSGSATSNLEAIGTAIASVGTTGAAFVSMLKAECPSS